MEGGGVEFALLFYNCMVHLLYIVYSGAPIKETLGSRPEETRVIISDGTSSRHVGIQSLLFDLLKAFDQIESIHKSDLFYPKIPTFLHACATCSELPSNISTMNQRISSIY